MQISKTFSEFCIFFLSLLVFIQVLHTDVSSGELSKEIRTGENWIQNGKVKVTVEGRSVSIHVRDVNTNGWNRLAIGILHGLLTPDKLMKPYREKYGGYYLFGKKAVVENLKTEIKDGFPIISFRTSLEDLWIDTQIKILGDSTFVLIETVGKSSDSLVPHWVQSFHRRWESSKWWMPAMTHLIFDDPYKSQPRIMAAVDYRYSHKGSVSTKYCIAYKPGIDKVWGILWPPKDGKPSGKRKIQFPPGPITCAFLNTPYVLFSEITDVENKEETMNSLGEKLYKQMCDFFKQ